MLAFTSAVEGLTGLALIVDPWIVVRLLMGAEPSGAGTAMSRVAGIALFALAVACWPIKYAEIGGKSALGAMLSYNLLATIYLANLGARGVLVGYLLWPAVAVHGVLTILLILAWRNDRQSREV